MTLTSREVFQLEMAGNDARKQKGVSMWRDEFDIAVDLILICLQKGFSSSAIMYRELPRSFPTLAVQQTHEVIVDTVFGKRMPFLSQTMRQSLDRELTISLKYIVLYSRQDVFQPPVGRKNTFAERRKT